jgi:hypothetical protein
MSQHGVNLPIFTRLIKKRSDTNLQPTEYRKLLQTPGKEWMAKKSPASNSGELY